MFWAQERVREKRAQRLRVTARLVDLHHDWCMLKVAWPSSVCVGSCLLCPMGVWKNGTTENDQSQLLNGMDGSEIVSLSCLPFQTKFAAVMSCWNIKMIPKSQTQRNQQTNKQKYKKSDQKYREVFTEKFPCKFSTVSVNYVHCTVCKLDFKVAHGSLWDVERHMKSAHHCEIWQATM